MSTSTSTRVTRRTASQNGHESFRSGEQTASSITTASYAELMGRRLISPAHSNNNNYYNNGNHGSSHEQTGDGNLEDATQALSLRLANFRTWLTQEAQATIHPAICIVNGEATDGTKNAPVLTVGSQQPSSEEKLKSIESQGRVGVIDWDDDCALYDRTMGCQVRAIREIKKDEVVWTIPRTAIITPDLVASSDAGRAILACCCLPDQPPMSDSSIAEPQFWDAFENTTICESSFNPKIARNTGPQLLVKILQERKKVEGAYRRAIERKSSSGDQPTEANLCAAGSISTRAPLLAFLIHQRFSSTARPLVSSETPASILQFQKATSFKDCALGRLKPIAKTSESPETFSPYVRTLPSSVCVPLCWKRNELALLAGCIPGLSLLQEVASRTLQLSTEFSALLDAGILERFPETFPDGLLTWERWVWAAAIVSSRTLPASCYFDAKNEGGNADTESGAGESAIQLQSRLEIWKELGVLVPLLDMLNHEIEAHQITWQPCVPSKEGQGTVGEEDSLAPHPPQAVAHCKIRKGSELFCCYGNLPNSQLILQYGFALISNTADEVRLGWRLMDAVGEVDPPCDSSIPRVEGQENVYESNDEKATNEWWTDERLSLLQEEAFSSAEEGFMEKLKGGGKMTAFAYNDGTYHPILLTAAVVATMPKDELLTHRSEKRGKLVLSDRHKGLLRRYLEFSFTRKLEKLLQNLDYGLKEHFLSLNLWTKASDGGLLYKAADESANTTAGWQSFFDANAYKAAMEVEKNYYAIGSDSCVLTLYDGQLRALMASIRGVSDGERLSKNLIDQLSDLGFTVSEPSEQEEHSDKKEPADASNGRERSGSKSPRNRKRNRKKNSNNGDRPPAVKLHVGNLAYTTTPADLYDFFSTMYGVENVLECHIPTERATGKSRGFGFVAMPEQVANTVLNSGRKHEIDGRLLKLARSNSAGSSGSNKSSSTSTPVASDRCIKCGYRPKYCVCSTPNLPGYGPPPNHYGRDRREYDGHGASGDRPGGDRYRDYYDERDWHRDYDRDRRDYGYDGRWEDGYEVHYDRSSRYSPDRRSRAARDAEDWGDDDSRGDSRSSSEREERERERKRSRGEEASKKKKSKKRERRGSRS